jgi:hypothetical protein
MRRRVLAAAAPVALAVALAALPIGADVYEGGEAREGLVVREMLRTGDWILPLWNGTVMPSKPPLFHWLAAAGAALTGADVTEHTLRAPSLALAGLVVLLVLLAGRAWGGEQTGLMAALVLATTPQFLNEAGDGRVDMTLTAAITGAQLAFVHALRGGGGPTRLLLALCLALAMLAKGPVGPGLVGLTALVSALTNRLLGPALRLVRPLPVLVFLAVAGGWYGLAYHHRGMDFVAKQIISENGEALLGGSRFPHRSPLFYLAPLVLGGFPWTLVLPWALARGWRSGDLARRHAVTWAAVVFVFFSFAPLKRAAYLLPLRPALALVIGWWLAEAAAEERPAGRWVALARALAVVTAAGLLALAAGAAAVRWGLVPSARLIEEAARREVDAAMYLRVVTQAWGAIAALGLAGALAAGLAARGLGRARWRDAALATTAVAACVTVVVYGFFVPARAAQKSVAPFAHAVRDRLGPGDHLALLASDEEIPFIFHVGRNVPVLAPAGAHPPDVPAGYYILDQARWRGWKAPAGWEEMLASPHLFSTHRHDLVLVRRQP